MEPVELEQEVRDFWNMTPEELDAEHIQKPIGTQSLKVTRWVTLPRAEFKRLQEQPAESTGEIETLEHEAFIHGEPVLLSVGDPRNSESTYCAHEVGAPYAVDPHAPDRIEQFMALWRRPTPK